MTSTLPQLQYIASAWFPCTVPGLTPGSVLQVDIAATIDMLKSRAIDIISEVNIITMKLLYLAGDSAS